MGENRRRLSPAEQDMGNWHLEHLSQLCKTLLFARANVSLLVSFISSPLYPPNFLSTTYLISHIHVSCSNASPLPVQQRLTNFNAHIPIVSGRP